MTRAEMERKAIRVRKCDLPLLLVIEGEGDDLAVQSLEPAGPHKLGARIGTVHPLLKELVARMLRPKKI